MYPSNFNIKMNEQKLMSGNLEPTNQLRNGKANCSKLYKNIRDKFKFNYSNVIPCNLYGPNDNFNQNKSHLIASIIQGVLCKEK